jgi:uncharacterized protein YndB with AHSA1/START domain
MLKKIAIVVVVLIAAILIFAATRPDDFRVERSINVKAPPEKVFALIDDFHSWPQWSPWEKLDPSMKRTLSAAPNGKGAAYAWEGNSEVGSGSMEITQSVPASKVVIDLHFIEPFEAQNVAEFTLAPLGDSTRVVWSMHGPMPYVSKVMCLFVSMDKLVGKDFEKGLANLKAVAES